MSNDAPPPLPPSAGQPSSMKAQWIIWTLVSTILPVLPWLFLDKSGDDMTGLMVMIGVALFFQLLASVAVAVGLAKKRGMGVGGTVGFTILFMLASVAIGTAVFFVACIGAITVG